PADERESAAGLLRQARENVAQSRRDPHFARRRCELNQRAVHVEQDRALFQVWYERRRKIHVDLCLSTIILSLHVEILRVSQRFNRSTPAVAPAPGAACVPRQCPSAFGRRRQVTSAPPRADTP